MKNIVILISGGGSNMAAIADACSAGNWESSLGARVALVASNRPDAGGLLLARQRGIRTAVVDHLLFDTREAFDDQLAQCVELAQPFLVLLAGFMRILSPGFVQRFADRLINIHPSLLPAFPGLHTHARAIEAGCRVAGATVHRVTHELDHGPILGQAAVPVLPDDTAQSLAQRVLVQEHLLYPKVVRELLR
jgi:phosphoribosylglycinamide formyltransferase-1